MNYVNKVIERYKQDGLVKGTNHGIRCGISRIKRIFIFLLSKLTDVIISAEKLLPLANYIVFECESDMEDNPRAIYEYLIQHKLNRSYRMVWIVNDVSFCRANYNENNVCFLNRNDYKNINRIKLNYYFYRSKLFIFSHPYWFKKRKEKQFVLNTWHGFGMKKLKNSKNDISNTFDKALVPSQFCKSLFAKDWPIEKLEVMEYPRQDFLLKGNKREIIRKLLNNYTKFSKIVMCMPTFRQTKNWVDSDRIDQYALGVINDNTELISFNEFLSNNNILIIVKIHPLQSRELLNGNNLSNIIYINNRDLFKKKVILYELLACCDALLTDVSSVFTDFLMLDRPIGFFMDNVTDYKRGYIVPNPLELMPGKFIYNPTDLKSFILDLIEGNDIFSNERIKTYNYLHSHRDADNSKRVVEWMFHQIGE